jgi:hypothetical protein
MMNSDEWRSPTFAFAFVTVAPNCDGVTAET